MNTLQLMDIARDCGVDLIDKAMRALDPPVRSSADKSYVIPHGQKDDPTAGIGTADAGILYQVTCRARYYDAATKILEDEMPLFTHQNADELGLVIERWIAKKRDNWEPRT